MSTASQFPFQALGLTHLIESDTPAPTPVQIKVAETTTGVGQYRIVNSSSTETAFIGFGATATQATAGAAAIVAGTPTNTLVMLPGAVEIVRFVNNAFVTSFSAAAADIFITPGQGL